MIVLRRRNLLKSGSSPIFCERTKLDKRRGCLLISLDIKRELDWINLSLPWTTDCGRLYRNASRGKESAKLHMRIIYVHANDFSSIVPSRLDNTVCEVWHNKTLSTWYIIRIRARNTRHKLSVKELASSRRSTWCAELDSESTSLLHRKVSR